MHAYFFRPLCDAWEVEDVGDGGAEGLLALHAGVEDGGDVGEGGARFLDVEGDEGDRDVADLFIKPLFRFIIEQYLHTTQLIQNTSQRPHIRLLIESFPFQNFR